MCGIAGYAGWRGVSPGVLGAMCDAIRHRGPDDEGQLIDGDVGIGMRRLSIIDVAGGHQPISNETDRVHIVFNGEIYNHRALRNQLRAAGHTFRTTSDTEVILHGYEEWGDDVLPRLDGMFCFAIWDAAKGELLLARDRIGIKPCFIAEHDGGIAFASELRCLLTLGVDPTPNRDAIAQYLMLGYVPESMAAVRGASKLPPGHLLTWSAATRSTRIRRWWSPIPAAPLRLTDDEAIEETRRLLQSAVSSHMESEVPLGAFLSGGIDSSTVVAYMQSHAASPVRTYSIGFREPGFDESPDARIVADHLGTIHTELIVAPDADEVVNDVISAFDEPFGDSSAVPTFLVSQLARQEVTVALSGDGGDELFGGYQRHIDAAHQWVLPKALRVLPRSIATMLPQGAYGRNRLLDLGRSGEGRFAQRVAAELQAQMGGLASDAFAQEHAALTLDSIFAEEFRSARHLDWTTQLTCADMLTYLSGDILTKVDRMSMAVSLEARPPLLDHRLVEFAVALPGQLKVRDGLGKWVLRKAVEGMLPARVMQKAKQGFAVPLREWFRGPLRYRLDALTAGAEAPVFEYVSRARVAVLVHEHLSTRRDHSSLLWRVLALDLWLRSLYAGSMSGKSQVKLSRHPTRTA